MERGRIADWYSGKNVLITGGTGFMGKVLIEKLLRCCPEIGTIYVLCRHKNGKTPITRLADVIIKPTIYDRLKIENASVLNKLVAVEGDVEQNVVVTKEKDREMLINQVSVVFHLAASRKLDASLATAVKTNTKGTLNMMTFCKQFKQLQVFVHVSSTSCSQVNFEVDEKFYPSPRDPYEVLNMVASGNPSSLEAMTPGVIDGFPNCYTFSKRLAESIVNEYSKDVPAIIIRPSVVMPAMYEPVPGWVDSLNGPSGIFVGSAKGVIRSVICCSERRPRAEFVPVDIAINSIISITANHNYKGEKGSTVACYNISSGDLFEQTWENILKKGMKQFLKYPLEGGLWYPRLTIRSNPYIHALFVFLFQTVPAYFIDFLMLLFHQKTYLVGIQNRISVNLDLFEGWNAPEIIVEKALHKQTSHPEDQKIFYIRNVDRDIDQYLLRVVLGLRQYGLNQPLSTLTKARIQLWVLYFLDLTVRGCVCYVIYSYISSILEFIDPSFKLPIPSYDWFDYLMQKTVS